MQADLTQSADRAGFAIANLEYAASAHETIIAYLDSGRPDVARQVAALALGLGTKAIRELDEARKQVDARIVSAA